MGSVPLMQREVPCMLYGLAVDLLSSCKLSKQWVKRAGWRCAALSATRVKHKRSHA